ncbi:hypothetical protein BSKO_02766 [Bryopsis sp. KO-2023]|nr:hypothetical protein BSKO_02766 [Bryopsis sp. KO-2023]
MNRVRCVEDKPEKDATVAQGDGDIAHDDMNIENREQEEGGEEYEDDGDSVDVNEGTADGSYDIAHSDVDIAHNGGVAVDEHEEGEKGKEEEEEEDEEEDEEDGEDEEDEEEEVDLDSLRDPLYAGCTLSLLQVWMTCVMYVLLRAVSSRMPRTWARFKTIMRVSKLSKFAYVMCTNCWDVVKESRYLGYLEASRRTDDDIDVMRWLGRSDPISRWWRPTDSDSHRTRDEYMHAADLANINVLTPEQAHIRGASVLMDLTYFTPDIMKVVGVGHLMMLGLVKGFLTQIKARFKTRERKESLRTYRQALAGVHLPTDFDGTLVDVTSDVVYENMFDLMLFVRGYEAFVFNGSLLRDELLAWRDLCTAARHYTSHRASVTPTMDVFLERAREAHEALVRYASLLLREVDTISLALDVGPCVVLRTHHQEKDVVQSILYPERARPLTEVVTTSHTFSFQAHRVSGRDATLFASVVRDAMDRWGFSLPGWAADELRPGTLRDTTRVLRKGVDGTEEFFSMGWSSSTRASDSTYVFTTFVDGSGVSEMFMGVVRGFFFVVDSEFEMRESHVVALVDLWQINYVTAVFGGGTRPVSLDNLFSVTVGGSRFDSYPVLLQDIPTKLMRLTEGNKNFFCMYKGM